MRERLKRMRARRNVAAIVAAAWMAASGPAEACRLALVLALDISASVDAGEYALQAEGLAAAMRDPGVREAISGLGGVHVSVFEWSGRNQQHLIAGWTALERDADILALADRVQAHRRSNSDYPTALGAAIGFAAGLLERGPPLCERQVLDVSGDGENNHGFEPRHAYRAFDFRGVTVNGLAVAGASRHVIGYYEREVLHGPGAFLEVAESYDDYAEAMKRKLLREILPPSFALRGD